MTSRIFELDLNETGFLCNLIINTVIKTAPPAADANVLLPVWLGELYMKLAHANDQMMAEESIAATRSAVEPPFILSPFHPRKH